MKSLISLLYCHERVEMAARERERDRQTDTDRETKKRTTAIIDTALGTDIPSLTSSASQLWATAQLRRVLSTHWLLSGLARISESAFETLDILLYS